MNSVTQGDQIRPDDLVICNHRLLRVAHVEHLGGRYRMTFNGTDEAIEIYSGEAITRVTFAAPRS